MTSPPALPESIESGGLSASQMRVLMRFLAVIVAVLLCYCLRWEWLRYLTSEFNLKLDSLAGLQLHRLSPETVEWRSVVYRYDIACTFADVWCGAIPLVWNLRRTIISNAITIAALGVALIAFNVVRLSFSDYIFALGVPWDWAHGLIGGLSYFAVWVWIWENRSW